MVACWKEVPLHWLNACSGAMIKETTAVSGFLQVNTQIIAMQKQKPWNKPRLMVIGNSGPMIIGSSSTLLVNLFLTIAHLHEMAPALLIRHLAQETMILSLAILQALATQLAWIPSKRSFLILSTASAKARIQTMKSNSAWPILLRSKSFSSTAADLRVNLATWLFFCE